MPRVMLHSSPNNYNTLVSSPLSDMLTFQCFSNTEREAYVQCVNQLARRGTVLLILAASGELKACSCLLNKKLGPHACSLYGTHASVQALV